MDKKINQLDGGTTEERIAMMKDFLGVRQDQSFQDIDDEEDENN